MDKVRRVVVGLLVATTTFSGITAVEAIKIAHNGFEVDLTIEQAEEVAEAVNEALAAREQAEKDMEDE